MANPGTIERPEIDHLDISSEERWLVTVYNNETNTWDEVMTILMIATSCDADEAFMETWEVDNIGYSVVHYGAEDECAHAAEIISQIGIRVEVTQEP